MKNKSKHHPKEKNHTPEISEFNILRKKLFVISFISIVVTFVALAIVGLKIFYPFHLLIGLSVYVLSFILIIRRIYLSRKTWKKFRAYTFSEKFFRREKKRLVLAVFFIIGTFCLFWLMPLGDNPFSEYSNEEIKTVIKDDLYKSVTAMDYLETTGTTLLNQLELDQSQSKNPTQISVAFDEFLQAVLYSESLTDRHRYFAFLPYGMGHERDTSFVIAYSLYAKKYEIVHKVMSSVSKDPYKKKVLNQYMKSIEQSNVYNTMIVRFYQPKTRMRITMGYLYMKMFSKPQVDEDMAFVMLHAKASQSYIYLKNNFLKTLINTGEVLIDHTESKMFQTWFPIQKKVAITMGRSIISTRGKNGIITEENAVEMQTYMQPGDIMLQRRNWHVSNVGIPGFWTHSALYTGDLETMNAYFASEFPYQNYANLASYIKEVHPDIYELYKGKDTLGYNNSVVEAIEPGVIIQSLPKSADADFVVVLRPNLLTKKDKMLSIFKAFEHVGKPYDFNFDFDTLDSLVCSEVIYDSYFKNQSINKQGLYFETSLINGRRMVSPLDIAKKFEREYTQQNPELAFVYLLKSNEDTQMTSIGNIEDFMKSIYWSKFSFLKRSD